MPTQFLIQETHSLRFAARSSDNPQCFILTDQRQNALACGTEEEAQATATEFTIRNPSLSVKVIQIAR